MKKLLIAAAVAGAFTSTAFAANVDLYGRVDTGLLYTHQSFGGVVEAADTNKFEMASGINSSSRFGLKGTEDLGDGYSVSFQLENGFHSDTGKMKGADDNRLFDREARLSLNTPYGTVSFGRMGALTSGAGTYDIFQATGDSMDGGHASYIGAGYWFGTDRYDNMVTLVTPSVNGFTGYAQYSFKTSGTEVARTRGNERYAGIGLTYAAGPLNVAVVADTILREGPETDANSDAQAFSFGANYDFGVTKAFFGAQYGTHQKVSLSGFNLPGDELDDTYRVKDGVVVADYVKGYNLHVGAATPLPCGVLTVSVFYDDYESEATNEITYKKYGVAFMHEYALSKRTTFYTGAGFWQFDGKFGDDDGFAARQKGIQATLGLQHKF